MPEPTAEPGLPGEMPVVPAVVAKPSLFRRIWRYHPPVFLGLSLVLGGVAYSMIPGGGAAPIEQTKTFYERGLAALRQVESPEKPMTPEAIRSTVAAAWTDFDILVRLRRDDLPRHPEFLNPWLLAGEAALLDARHFPDQRRERAERALACYGLATDWEQLKRDDDEAAIYAMRNHLDPERSVPTGDGLKAWRDEREKRAAELEERIARRLVYLRYRRALAAAAAGMPALAETELTALARERELAEIRREPGARPTEEKPGSTLLPRPFEMTPEDWNRIHFHLAELFAKGRRPAEAEKEYRLFLLAAPRSLERFDAILRLGALLAERGRQALAEAPRDPAESAEAQERARQSFRAAAGVFGQAVEEGATEEVLAEAYFRGGQALLALAESLEEGLSSWWENAAEAGSAMEAALAAFTGRPLPARTRTLAAALGAQWTQPDALPDPAAPLAAAAGLTLRFAAEPPRTRRAERETTLAQARRWFESSQSATRFRNPSRVFIARTLLAEGRHEEARRLFQYALEQAPDAQVQLACRLGESRAFVASGRPDAARARMLGLPEIESAPPLRAPEVDWTPFCIRLHEKGQAGAPDPARRIWEFLPPDERALVRRAGLVRRAETDVRDRLLPVLNALLRRSDFWSEADFAAVEPPPAARHLLARDRSLWNDEETSALNRMLLEAALPREIVPAVQVRIHTPFPPPAAFGDGLLISESEVAGFLGSLAGLYLNKADTAAREAEAAAKDPRAWRRALVAERRALYDAAEVNEFLLSCYRVRRESAWIETAGLYARLAARLGSEPFLEPRRATELTVRAAESYLRAADAAELPGGPREEEALLRAGWSLYASGRYGLAVETLRRHQTRHAASDRAAWAQNLLARALRHLGRWNEVETVLRSNIDRRTPEGQKSLYYLGAALAQIGESPDSEGKPKDRLGDPADPLPKLEEKGPRIESALQAFNHLRSLGGIAPESRPWRWATFDLGRLHARIAERERAARPDKPETWLSFFRTAAESLREGLERYPIRSGNDGPGLDPATEPDDCREVRRARFVAESTLARVHATLGEAAEERSRLAACLDATAYPDDLFETPADPGPARPVLGEAEGPIYPAPWLRELRRDIYFRLAQALRDEGERQGAAGATATGAGQAAAAQGARQAFEEALRIYQLAYDRLPPRDAPALMVGMAECLRRIGRTEEALAKYALARSAARNLKDAAERPGEAGPAFWERVATEREKDLEEGFRR